MKIFLADAENIYFPQIKDYFREIESSYDNGNYRSAMVMLYSTIVCDLLLKLKELSDVYSDPKAETILEDINAKRKQATNSQWEWDLIKRIKAETELLSDESFAMIHHIYDYRNISAHPAMNEEYELISPSAEITIAYIKQALKDIFVKPSVFASSIVDRISDDIAAKKELYKKDFPSFKHYLEKVYFQRMSEKMVCQVFKAFWKFTFIKTDEEAVYKENRYINRLTIEAILENYPETIYSFISDNKSYFSVPQDSSCLIHMCVLLAFYPIIYRKLDETTRFQIDDYNNEKEIRVIKWFVKGDLRQHIEEFETENNRLSENYLAILWLVCKGQGEPSLFKKFIIQYYAKSPDYTSAKLRFDNVLSQYFKIFTAEDFIEIIEAINTNDQIYGYGWQKGRNDQLLKYAKPFLPDDFSLSAYPNFKYTQEENDENGEEKTQEEDEERSTDPVELDLPF